MSEQINEMQDKNAQELTQTNDAKNNEGIGETSKRPRIRRHIPMSEKVSAYNSDGNSYRREGGYQPRNNNYQHFEGNYQQRDNNYRQQRSYNPSYQRPERSSYDNNYRNNRYNNQDGNSYSPRETFSTRPDFNQQQNNEGGYNNERRYNGNNNGYSRNNGGYNGNNGGYNNYNRRPQAGGNYQRRPYNNDRQQEGNNYNRYDNNYRDNNYSQSNYRNPNGRPNYNRPDNRRQQGNYPQGEYQQRGGYSQQRPQHFQQRPQQGNHSVYSQKKILRYKEENVDPNQPIRLNKFMANAGICSRREADKYITAGLVTVNGKIVTELGTKVMRTDEIKFHEESVKLEDKIYVILNKPKDYVTTSDDPLNRKTVMDLVKNACPERIYPIGRLDRNTTGVLLLTNDGDMASKLMHPKFLKKKIYHVYLNKSVSAGDMNQILTGLQLEDGEIKADAIEYASETDKKQVGIEIHSGKNRIVRRIFEHLGYKVVKLDRVYFAGLTKKNLRRGEWRFLTEEEVRILRMGAFE